MTSISGLAEVASLVGDPARANMLNALMDGRALTASELAYAARVSASTASAHLASLTTANLLSVARQGRHRYYRLATPLVASMLEVIMTVASAGSVSCQSRWRGGAALREARTCYDHLAGRLGVALADAFVARGYAHLDHDGGVLTESGIALLRSLNVKVEEGRRVLCRPCLDWSERRPHLAGRLGAALCSHSFEQGWVRRVRDTRAVAVTPEGRRAFETLFGILSDAEKQPAAGPCANPPREISSA